jgi:hypothetical protein
MEALSLPEPTQSPSLLPDRTVCIPGDNPPLRIHVSISCRTLLCNTLVFHTLDYRMRFHNVNQSDTYIQRQVHAIRRSRDVL